MGLGGGATLSFSCKVSTDFTSSLMKETASEELVETIAACNSSAISTPYSFISSTSERDRMLPAAMESKQSFRCVWNLTGKIAESAESCTNISLNNFAEGCIKEGWRVLSMNMATKVFTAGK